MDGVTKVEQLQETLREYAIRDVPDDIDPWPSIQGRIAQTISLTGKAESKSPRALSAIPNLDGARAQRLRFRFNIQMLLIMVLGVTTLGIAVLASVKFATPGAGGSDFVPGGKVRHILISTEQETAPLTNEKRELMTGTIDIWLTNGPSNLRQRTTYRQFGSSISTPESFDVWVQDSTLYTLVPDKKIVLWQSWPFASIYAPNPNIISNMLQQPHARIISDTVLAGRNIMVIESVSPEDDMQVWIDKDTYRAFQWKNIRMQNGVRIGLNAEKIVVDELLDTSALAPDFFEFKLPEGYTLVERVIPTPVITSSTPTAKVTP